MIIWWTSTARNEKIVEKLLSFDEMKRATRVCWTVYAEDGKTALAHVTDTITYLGLFELSRVRTLS